MRYKSVKWGDVEQIRLPLEQAKEDYWWEYANSMHAEIVREINHKINSHKHRRWL